MFSDKLFKETITKDSIKETFEVYVAKKTDNLTGKTIIKVLEGVDGISVEQFNKTLNHQADFIYKRIQRGGYHFYPLKEVKIPKEPGLSVEEAIKKDKIRILSVASIRDVIVQKLLYDYLNNIVEAEFSKLNHVSFAYRKGLNAQKAAQKVFSDINSGYIAALDADLKGFFDTIPHQLLFEQVKKFFHHMPEVQKLIYRFIHVDKGWTVKRGIKTKVIRKKREKGIPQGGILSGMLANIYLHQFDTWIMETLGNKYDLKYTRYADDFIILTKNADDILCIQNECKEFLRSLELILHPDPQKTKIIHIQHNRSIDFVGFKISKGQIGIKEQNVDKFKSRILKILNETDFSKSKALQLLKYKLSFKYYGNEVKQFQCRTCNKIDVTRNWMKFFLVITDVEQLRKIDYWVYKKINYYYFEKTGERLPKKTIKGMNFSSLEMLYYRYRKELKGNSDFCKCGHKEKDIYPTLNPYEDLFPTY
ncbi:reverse transcriptase domain-containing protein [Metasolibacillus meyeri]|uniref:Reverse transcriptase domain-containing protein n=1 Tax=Metasolibacillus meyeri TaxID=1071052 RepID=A0AAW9NTL1_9BACL|nr:reverse transcriptase domain-containing protein [Metasolibacillus meyeri]MEC1178629.1 reverse transcriptase domain-containing protein [Metasolibacillus meyeri]